MKKTPIYQLLVDEFDTESGMFLISLVEDPAMQVQAIKLSESETKVVTLKATDTMKQYLTSAVIIPDKNIVRLDEAGEKYFIQFTASEVEKIRDKFFQSSGNLSLSNKNHVEADTVQAQLIESWIITDPKMDKAVALGFQGLPQGTMMATYKVLDKDFWDSEVMTGNVTGFSLEGRFKQTELQLSNQTPTDKEDEVLDAETILDYILSQLYPTDDDSQ